MKVSTYLAFKFLIGRHKSWLLSLLSTMAVAGVMVSVGAFVVVDVVMSGHSQYLQDKILGFSSHLSLTLGNDPSKAKELASQMKGMNEVQDAQWFITGEGLIQNEFGDQEGVRVRGVRPGAIPPGLKVHFYPGESWQSLSGHESKLPGILIGKALLERWGGDWVIGRPSLIYPLGDVGPTGEIEPSELEFRLVGSFQTGYYDYDNRFAIIGYSQARELFGPEQGIKLGVFLKHPQEVRAFRDQLLELPGIQSIQSWDQQNAKLFSALKMDRLGRFLILGLMMLLASFNILSMLMLIAYERRQDLAVLRACGLSNSQIMGIFYRAGLAIGGLGSLMGILLGLGLIGVLTQFNLNLSFLYYLDDLPVDISWLVLVAAFCIATILSVLASILPAREGRQMSVIKALRYE